MKLANLKSGKIAKVISVDIKNEKVKRHLLEMGLVKNTIICISKKAPFGDPICIKLRGYELAINKNEAKNILVEVIPYT